MRAPLTLLLILLAFLPGRAFGGADSSLRHALAAQALLGPGFWSAVVRIENESRHGPYPRTLYALVFEVADILWFYCDRDGTQSLSLHVGCTAEEKRDLSPLFREIDPGFRRWEFVSDERMAVPGRKPPPNACFIASLAAWQDLARTSRGPLRAMLLSYYSDTPRGREGHTVLAYAQGGEWRVLDSDAPSASFASAVDPTTQPLALARAMAGNDVQRARTLPLPTLPAPVVPSWAGNTAHPPAVGQRG